MAYTIVQKFISQNRSGKTLNAKGTVLHETATPGASDENEFNYFNSGYRGASAHAFVDYDSITQTVPWNEQSWHAGSTANKSYIGIELCNYPDAAKFNEVWKRAVWLFAYVHVNIIKVTTINKDTLMSHAEVSQKWGETDHNDPIAYFGQFGKTVDNFRSEVQSEINRMLNVPENNGDPKVVQLQANLNRLKITDYGNNVLAEDGRLGPKTKASITKFQSITGIAQDGSMGPISTSVLNQILAKPVLRYGAQGYAVRYVQFRIGSAIDGKFGPNTRNAVIAFQAKNGLVQDGVVGPKTWAKLIG